MHLVRSQAGELEKEAVVERQNAVSADLGLGHPAADAVGIELLTPRGIQRVRDVHACAVAADLEHLRSAIERPSVSRGVWRAVDNRADADRCDEPGIERI